MAWSLAAIEFVAWSVLEEEGSGEKVAEAALNIACKANPFLAWNIAHMEIFDEVGMCLRRSLTFSEIVREQLIYLTTDVLRCLVCLDGESISILYIE